MTIVIDTLYAGPLAPLGPDNVPSGIRKAPLRAPWRIEPDGIIGDAQGDTRVHGGPEKAVHHYPREHYAAWLADATDPLPADTVPPAFGENLSTIGLTEADVCVGDIYRLGPVVLQVSQGRQPCWRLNARFARPDMSRRVQESGRTGWYYRVLQPGIVSPGATFERIERPHPGWPLARLIRVLYRDRLDTAQLTEMAELPALAESWRKLCRKRLQSHRVENWARRLDG